MSSPGSLIALAKMTRWTIQARQGKYNTFAKLIDVPEIHSASSTHWFASMVCRSDCQRSWIETACCT
jgi:hypothetical protein